MSDYITRDELRRVLEAMRNNPWGNANLAADGALAALATLAPAEPADERIYPCADCGTMRSKAEGGTTFTVCDECWDKHYKRGPAEPALPDHDPLASKDHGVARAASMPEVARLRKEWWSPEEHKAEVSKRCFEEHHRVTKQWKSLFDAMCDRAYKAEARVREVEGELAATSEIADALQAERGGRKV